jgi:hypothetical protein
MKRRFFGMVMMVALGLFMVACSSDDDNSSGGWAEDFLSGKMYSTKEGTVYFYRNGSFLFEVNEVKPGSGMIGGIDDYVAFGTWTAVGDLATTVLLANNIGTEMSRRYVPEKIRIKERDDYRYAEDDKTGELVNYQPGYGFTDTNNSGDKDKGVCGSWRTKYYPSSLGIGVEPEYYANLTSDGTATLSGKDGSGLEVNTTYTAARGKITFEKFLNGKRESFYYAITKSGGMYFYDMTTGSSLFCWYKTGK